MAANPYLSQAASNLVRAAQAKQQELSQLRADTDNRIRHLDSEIARLEREASSASTLLLASASMNDSDRTRTQQTIRDLQAQVAQLKSERDQLRTDSENQSRLKTDQINTLNQKASELDHLDL